MEEGNENIIKEFSNYLPSCFSSLILTRCNEIEFDENIFIEHSVGCLHTHTLSLSLSLLLLFHFFHYISFSSSVCIRLSGVRLKCAEANRRIHFTKDVQFVERGKCDEYQVPNHQYRSVPSIQLPAVQMGR